MKQRRVTLSLFKAMLRSAGMHDRYPVLKAMLTVQPRANYDRTSKSWEPIPLPDVSAASLAVEQGFIGMMQSDTPTANTLSHVSPVFFNPAAAASHSGVDSLRAIFRDSNLSESDAIDAGDFSAPCKSRATADLPGQASKVSADLKRMWHVGRTSAC